MASTDGSRVPGDVLERMLELEESELTKIGVRGHADRLGCTKSGAGVAVSGRALAGSGGMILGSLLVLRLDGVFLAVPVAGT